jgi:hypothetical protein
MIAVLLFYLPLLTLTVGIELVVVSMLARQRRRDALRACIASNLFTHPLATLALWGAGARALGVIEIAVLLVEWVAYSHLLRLSPARALVLALPANASSLAPGVLLGVLFLYH